MSTTISKHGLVLLISALILAAPMALAQWDEDEPMAPAEDGQAGELAGSFAAENSAPAEEEIVNESFFYDRLSPHGEWLWTTEYGWVWHPQGIWEGWRPYTYGQWVYTEHGWTWSSSFPWGWAAFHYGRWAHLDYIGWVWVPGTQWAPAWVMWRHSDIYIGWSPLLAG